MKKLLVAAAIFGMFATEASAESLFMYPDIKCAEDRNLTKENGLSISLIKLISSISDDVFVVRLFGGVHMFITDRGRSCIDSGLVSLGENQKYNDGIAIRSGDSLLITFSSYKKADESIYKTPGANINSLIQMHLTYTEQHKAYDLKRVVLVEKLIHDGGQVILNDQDIPPVKIRYAFSED